ncbi:hypothetical protein LTR35_018410, partial [Friedmanniomyces endolithicus]
FYENSFYLNTTQSVIIRGFVRGTVHYANNALFGFGDVSFMTDKEEFIHLNYASFIQEWIANFDTGEGSVDIFEMFSAGRIDGVPIPALQTPGNM